MTITVKQKQQITAKTAKRANTVSFPEMACSATISLTTLYTKGNYHLLKCVHFLEKFPSNFSFSESKTHRKQ